MTVAAAMLVFMLVVSVYVMIMLFHDIHFFLDHRLLVLRGYRDSYRRTDRTAYHGSVTTANAVAHCRAYSAAERAAYSSVRHAAC